MPIVMYLLYFVGYHVVTKMVILGKAYYRRTTLPHIKV
jgi:hypothetical protein